MNKVDFSAFLKHGSSGHLIGAGGVSMSPLMEVLGHMGLRVTGSDSKDSESVKKLRSLGFKIAVGHTAENIGNAEFVIRTAAAHDDNPEVITARERGIPVYARAEAWGVIMREYEHAICISGTHGKTTTTSMVTHILLNAGRDPTVMIGGTLPLLNSGYRIGKGNTIVLEADEYYNSFHFFFPSIAVILNISMDHPDFFSGLGDVKSSFRAFADLVPETGFVIANCDDPNAMDAISGIYRKVITFGINPEAELSAKNIRTGVTTEFDMFYLGNEFAHITLNVPGIHNVYNALGAAAAAVVSGVGAQDIRKGLESFRGASRRLELKGCYNGADIYDDYAHHPDEVRALLRAVSDMGYKRIICVFQPHTYSRLNAMLDEFALELSSADILLVAEIFAAREQNTLGISSRLLADKIPGALYFPDNTHMLDELSVLAREGDIILTVGAGDIYLIGEELVKKAQVP